MEDGRGVSSAQLARWLGTTAATVRKDLAWAEGNHPGSLWEPAELVRKLSGLLGLEQPVRAVLVGLDDWAVDLLARRRVRYGDWDLVMGFDSRTNRLETLDLEIPLYPSADIAAKVAEAGIKAAVLATGPDQAQRQLERLVQGGILGVLNWTGAALRAPKGVVLMNGGFQQEWSLLAGRLAEAFPGGKNEPSV